MYYGYKSFTKKERKILLLEEEIKLLEKKKDLLTTLQSEYYKEYFDAPRSEYSLLTDIPKNPGTDIHVLFDYSILNVDTIGDIICELIKRYENKDYMSRRVNKIERWDNSFGYYYVSLPRLVIGKEDKIEYLNKREDNIIISYNSYSKIDNYPTDKPVIWKATSSYKAYEESSNYNFLINSKDDLSFDYHNLEYIKELIYSLAYYQKQHDIESMSSSDTWDVYRKIYKKSI